MDPVGFESHDHDHCISTALTVAEAECREKGLQLTPVRKRVLELLLSRHKAMGAYDVLETLREEGLGSQPPVAYRALDFLVTHGFAHRIERLNAFIACAHPGERHAPSFLICRGCSAVAEAPGRPAARALRGAAEDMGFVLERVMIEAEGLCPECAHEGSAA
ncbi:helix-turn-helix domain-containing protein [Thalassococcus lentus]|uniref:Transcriptional repressor n=1 Tax=Thalassococcus lentus TaxID=1210524 RepID=A0ABT4XTX9_9RHOB|nr:transcriptional repressor [Thalassococcus lentus]MDA7425436.1 transcriptional repressor [Thalassococcus lentus]